MRLIIILITLMLCSCGTNTANIKSNEFKKNKMTEYALKLNNEDISLGDTIFINTTLYNTNNQIKEYTSSYLPENNFYITKSIYNDKNDLIQEVSTARHDTTPSIKNYFYKNDRLNSIKYELNSGSTLMKSVETFDYTKDGNLLESILIKSFFDTETNSILSKITELNTYDENGNLIETKLENNSYPEENSLTKYHFDSNLLSHYEQFDFNNNLIIKTRYEYEFNEKSDWIERKRFLNDTLKYINRRVIEYIK